MIEASVLRSPDDGEQMNPSGVVYLCLLAMTGCASVRDALVQDQMYLRNSREASRTFRKFHAKTAAAHDFPDHYWCGFHDGYVGVAMGASGCPPTLPPKQYWHAQYRSAEGKLVVTAWYNGYAEGAAAAQSSDAADRNRVHTALDVYGTGNHEVSAELGISEYSLAPIAPSTPTLLVPEEFVPPAPGLGPGFELPAPDTEPNAVNDFGLSVP